MRKKLVTLMLAGIMAFSMAACGESNSSQETQADATTEEGSGVEKTEEVKEPTDLTGTWKSEENNGSWQEAVISNDRIEINWVSDNGDTKSIYWIGTYEAPTEAVDEYVWTSDRNKEETDNALLASTDDTKEFTYKSGVLSYEASALGTTTTVKMEKE